MKIIINQPRSSYFVGGAEMISFEHAMNFLKLGNDVSFFTLSPQSIGLEYSEQYKKFYNSYCNKINIIEITQDKSIIDIYKIQPGENRCRWNIESIFYNQKLYEFLVNRQAEYGAMLSYYNLDAVFLPKSLVCKNVLYLCGTPKQQDDFQGSFLSVYDKVFAISDKVKDYWKVYRSDNMEIVPTGVDNERFSLKVFSSTDNQEINMLYVGRLIARKNVDKIIYAVEKLRQKYSINLVIVGDGPERSKLEKLSNKNRFIGLVADTEKYFSDADIFISPSEYGEGLQGCILEAMSCGLTVVATNTDINRTLLKDNRGFVVEPSINDIIDGLEKAIKTDRVAISKRSRKYIIENFNWTDKTRKIEDGLK